MVKYIFWTIVIYFLIRFIFNFLVPVFRATRQMRSQVRDFQNKMEEEQNFRSGANNTANPDHKSTARKDYIDFEEIK